MSRNFIYFVAGLCLGGAAGAYATAYYLSSKFDAQYKDLKEYYEHKSDNSADDGDEKKDSEPSEPEIKTIDDAIDAIKTGEIDQENQMRQEVVSVVKTRYDKISGEVISTEPITSDLLAQEEHPEDDDPEEPKEPYVITAEEYAEPLPYYDKVRLYYDISYDEDGIAEDGELLDADEELVIDPFTDANIGEDAIDILDKGENKAYVYIRNDKTSTDYEVMVRRFE